MDIVQPAGPLVGATLVVVLARRRLYRLCYVFPIYVATVSLAELLPILWPRTFLNWTFWLTKESAYVLIKLALALELAGLIFGPFPAAWAAVRRLTIATVLIMAAAAGASVVAAPDLYALAQTMHTSLATGTALLLVAILTLVLWYNLPVHALHQAILRGLVPYLLVFAVVLQLLISYGWSVRQSVSILNACSYLAVLLYWTQRARTLPITTRSDSWIVQRLQPWRNRLD